MLRSKTNERDINCQEDDTWQGAASARQEKFGERSGTNPSGNWHEKLTPIVSLARVIRRLTRCRWTEPWTEKFEEFDESL